MNYNKRGLVISILIVLLMIINFTRLKGADEIRPILMVSLIVLGVALGILLVNIILLIKSRKR